MIVELEGFAIYPGKWQRAQEWLAFLRRNQTKVNRTLIAENMSLEHIFSITFDNTLYLCWYSNQTASANPVEQSADPIDRQHVEFWNECVDPDKPSLKFKLEATFIPPEVD
ncbi:DUF6176 family protein [Levilactobacillus brevis]|uniref:DUF6176 family protein n=1 Tax=Levilactobacillus brevis TaxID=1580 RepID=UPI003EBD3EF8